MDQDKQTQQLQQQLSETITAQSFFKQDTGRLWEQLATKEINRLIKDITSEKYERDLEGYNLANTELRVWRTMLRKMQVAASPVRRAKLEERLAQDG